MAKARRPARIGYCIVGFFLIFLGWNGTASHDREPAQIPYVVSGGIAGLALVVLGAALIVAHSLRTDRVELRGSIDDLRAATERLANGSTIAGGPASDAGTGGFAPAPRVTPGEAGAGAANPQPGAPAPP